MEQNVTFHHSSGRNYRPKWYNLKKALKVALLLAVCIWLLYQIQQYSHEKHTQNKLNEEHRLLGRKGDVGLIVRPTLDFEIGNALGEDERREDSEEKIALQTSETESTIGPGQGEMGYGVYGFHDANGVPPGSLNLVNSTPYDPRGDDDQEKSLHHEIESNLDTFSTNRTSVMQVDNIA